MEEHKQPRKSPPRTPSRHVTGEKQSFPSEVPATIGQAEKGTKPACQGAIQSMNPWQEQLPFPLSSWSDPGVGCVISHLTFTAVLQGKYHYPHFAGEENNFAERLNNLPRVTQPESSKAEIWTHVLLTTTMYTVLLWPSSLKETIGQFRQRHMKLHFGPNGVKSYHFPHSWSTEWNTPRTQLKSQLNETIPRTFHVSRVACVVCSLTSAPSEQGMSQESGGRCSLYLGRGSSNSGISLPQRFPNPSDGNTQHV